MVIRQRPMASLLYLYMWTMPMVFWHWLCQQIFMCDVIPSFPSGIWINTVEQTAIRLIRQAHEDKLRHGKIYIKEKIKPTNKWSRMNRDLLRDKNPSIIYFVFKYIIVLKYDIFFHWSHCNVVTIGGLLASCHCNWATVRNYGY